MANLRVPTSRFLPSAASPATFHVGAEVDEDPDRMP
jgi:hypothetical protein